MPASSQRMVPQLPNNSTVTIQLPETFHKQSPDNVRQFTLGIATQGAVKDVTAVHPVCWASAGLS